MTRVTIANMHCGGCAKGVRATLSTLAGGDTVEIDLDRRAATIDAADADLVLATLRADGWETQLAAIQTGPNTA